MLNDTKLLHLVPFYCKYCFTVISLCFNIFKKTGYK